MLCLTSMHPNFGEDALFEIKEDCQQPGGITANVPVWGFLLSFRVRDLEALKETRACLLLLVGLTP